MAFDPNDPLMNPDAAKQWFNTPPPPAAPSGAPAGTGQSHTAPGAVSPLARWSSVPMGADLSAAPSDKKPPEVPELVSAPEDTRGSTTSAMATGASAGNLNDITPPPTFGPGATGAGAEAVNLHNYGVVSGKANAEAPAEAILRFGKAEQDYQAAAGQESDALSKKLTERQAKMDESLALMARHQEQNDAEVRKRLAAIDEASARTTADLKDTGKFWRNPANVLSSIVMSFLPMAGVGNDAGIKWVQKAVADDWNQRREQANMELGALRSNLQAYRDIAGDQKAGDLLALSESWKQVGMDAQRIAAQFGSAKSKATGEMLMALAEEKSAEAKNNMLTRLYVLGLMNPAVAAKLKNAGAETVGPGGLPGPEYGAPQPGVSKPGVPSPTGEIAGQAAEQLAGDLVGLPPVVAAARRQQALKAQPVAGPAAPATKAGVSAITPAGGPGSKESGDFWLPNGMPNPNRSIDPSTESTFSSPQERDAYRKALRNLDMDLTNRVLGEHKGPITKEVFRQKLALEYSKYKQTVVYPQVSEAKKAAAPFVQGLTVNQEARKALADLRAEFTTKDGRFNAEAYRDALKDFSNVNLVSSSLANSLNKWSEEIGSTESQRSAMMERVMKARVAVAQSLSTARKDIYGALAKHELEDASNLVAVDSSPQRIDAFLEMSAKTYQAQANNAAPPDPIAKAFYLSTIPRWHAPTNVSGRRVK